MAYGVTDQGFSRKPLAVCVDDEKEDLRAAFGAGIHLEPHNVFGQFARRMGERFSKVWELAEAVYHAMYPGTSSGSSLVNVCSFTGTTQKAARKTLVTGVTLGGTPGTVVAAGKVASVTGAGDRFVLKDPVTIGGGGTAPGVFEAEEFGPIPCYAGTLTTIETAVSGWTSVTNPVDGIIGANLESDAALRQRREEELALGGESTLPAIRSEVLDVEGVTSCTVFENVTGATSGDGIPAKAFEVVVSGGTDADVAAAIFRSKSAGMQAHGSTVVNVDDAEGTAHAIGFTRPADVNVYAAVSVKIDADTFPADGDDQIKQAVADAADADFDQGETAYSSRLYPAVLAVSGVVNVASILIGISEPPAATSVAITSRQRAAFDTSRTTVAHV